MNRSRLLKTLLQRFERTHSRIAKPIGNQEAEPETVLERDAGLTVAESRVTESVVQGLRNKEIAAELNLIIRTFENQVSRISAKKNFSDRVENDRHIISKRSE